MAPATSPDAETTQRGRRRATTVSSVASSVTRGVEHAASDILSRDPPAGFFAATANVASQAPTLSEIRRGSFGSDGWRSSTEVQVDTRRRTSSLRSTDGRRRSRRISGEDKGEDGARLVLKEFPALTEEPSRLEELEFHEVQEGMEPFPSFDAAEKQESARLELREHIAPAAYPAPTPIRHDDRIYSSGYIPPPHIPWTTSTAIALRAFSGWVITPFGFFLTLYALNVVAWGGMLFLLLCNASPAMCWAPIHNAETAQHYPPAQALALGKKYPVYFNCNDINSPRRIWLEIDSQILNALFCVTGFGLIPWRFRDWWFLLLWRCRREAKVGKEKKMEGLRKLAGIYRSWVRLPGSETLDVVRKEEYEEEVREKMATNGDNAAVSSALTRDKEDDLRLPILLNKAPEPPLTGVRAPGTALWKIDFFVWSQVLNTFLQACLCGFMWGMDRYNRPSWATGLFIGLACIVAGAGGFVSYLEGKKAKRVEGVAAKQPDGGKHGGTDIELGITPQVTVQRSAEEDFKAR